MPGIAAVRQVSDEPDWPTIDRLPMSIPRRLAEFHCRHVSRHLTEYMSPMSHYRRRELISAHTTASSRLDASEYAFWPLDMGSQTRHDRSSLTFIGRRRFRRQMPEIGIPRHLIEEYWDFTPIVSDE